MLRILVVCIFFTAGALSFPQGKDNAFVVSSTTPAAENEAKKDGDSEAKVPKIYEMNVFSNVSNRFATTVITSKVKNYGKTAQEATFSVVLPDSAYITGFIMEIGGKNYTAYVKEKEEAKQVYEAAVASGIGAAHVAANARDSNRFTVSVNIEPQSKAVFYLNYEELLKRKQNYELVINIHPKQPVPNLNVEVLINETSPLINIKTPPLRSGNDVRDAEGDLDPRATVTKLDDKSALIKFTPTPEKQKEYAHVLGTKEDEGFSGQFVVQYDVQRDSTGGEVLVKDGYFVHFFAPSDIKPLPKHIIFVLDTSGSMWGQRIDQLKQAMTSILSELKPEDLFSLVEFNSNIKVWNVNDPTKNVQFPVDSRNIYDSQLDHPIDDVLFPEAFPADADTIKKANKVVNEFNAEGGTNIYEAIKVGIHLAKVQRGKESDNKRQSLIMFLTDGEPTVGITQPETIISKISEINQHVPIFSLSFGDGADRNFLQKISLHNDGFARHIYEAADASLQLQDFYKQISSPILANVTFKYADDAKQLTRTTFPNYFGGGEIVICGTIDRGFGPDRIPVIDAWSFGGPIQFKPKIENPIGDMERLWAYLTVQQLLEEKEVAKNKTENEKKALDIALKYSFVTPLTSLVVVKPNETEKAVDTEAADKSTDEYNHNFAPLMASVPLHAQSIIPISGSSGFSAGSGALPMSFGGAYNRGPQLSLQSAPSFGFGAAGPAGIPVVPGPPPQDFYPSQPPSMRPAYTTYYTTTVRTSTLHTSTTRKPKVEELMAILTWLTNKYDAATDTVILPNGTFQLGIDEQVDETKACSNAPNSTTGHCTLLQNCKSIHTVLTSLPIYMQHFCAIDNYAGVCCP